MFVYFRTGIFCLLYLSSDAEYVFFGEALDDTVVSSDAEIGPIQLSSPVVFFGAKERNLYVRMINPQRMHRGL